MVYYISSNIYHQTIISTVKEQNEVILGQQIQNHMILLKFIKSNIASLSDSDKLIIDLSAMDDSDEDILQAIKIFRTMYDETRIIIIAPNRLAGDGLLAQLFALGILNIIATLDYLELKTELELCLSEKGKSFKDALEFKDVRRIESTNTKKEIKVVSKVMIGIAGCQKRMGVTHNSVVMAGYLRKQGFLVAVVEYNQSGDFQKIRNGFDEKFHDHLYFSMGGIDYYPDATKEALQVVLEKSYNFIILDYGYYKECDLTSFHKCHVKIMVAGSKAWELNQVAEVLKIYDDETLAHIFFYFNLTAREFEKTIRKEMKYSTGLPINVFFLKYVSDPFNTYDFPEADTLLADYLPAAPKKKRWTFGIKRK